MLRLIALVVSIGIADSVNPDDDRAGSLPGRLRRRPLEGEPVHRRGLWRLPARRSRHRTRSWTTAAVADPASEPPSQLRARDRRRRGDAHRRCIPMGLSGSAQSRRDAPEVRIRGKSSALLGATITAVELPTAFPYFAAIAAIVGSGFDIMRQLILLVLFNVCFVLPLLGILAMLEFAGPNAKRLLATGRAQARGPLAGRPRRVVPAGRSVRDDPRCHRPGKPASQRLRHVLTPPEALPAPLIVCRGPRSGTFQRGAARSDFSCAPSWMSVG